MTTTFLDEIITKAEAIKNTPIKVTQSMADANYEHVVNTEAAYLYLINMLKSIQMELKN